MPRTAKLEERKRRPARGFITAPAAGAADAAWEQFRKSRSAKSRNALIERYMPFVRAIATRIASELPGSIQYDDLVSAGTFGLMDAVVRYDPELGARFETYCAVRIRGAIVDELRYLNWMPRLQSARATKVGAAFQALTGELGRAPSPREIASKTGLKVRDVNNARPNGRHHMSLTSTSATEHGDDKCARIDILEARGLCNPVDLLQEKEWRDILDREIRRLPEPQRLLVILYYYDELTMKQIGEVLNVTESRVCQMHTGILDRLGQRLAELDETAARGA